MSLFVWDSIQPIGKPGPPGAYKKPGRPPQPHTTTLPRREDAARATATAAGDQLPTARPPPPDGSRPADTSLPRPRQRRPPARRPGLRLRPAPSPPTAPTLRPSVRPPAALRPTMSSSAGLGTIPFAFVLLIALCSRVSAGRAPGPAWRGVPVGRGRGWGRGRGRKGEGRGRKRKGKGRACARLTASPPAARLRPGLQRPVPVPGPGPALPRRRQPGAGRLRLLPRLRQAAGRAVHRARPLRPAQGPLL